MDQLFGLFLVLVVIAVLVSAIALPIVALVLTLSYRKRIARLEARIDELQATLGNRPSTAAHEAPPPEPTTPPPPASAPAFSANNIESIIGRRWVGWVAISLILFATAFFLKYAFDNRWIGELGRVAIGITFGIGMGLAGYRYHQRGWRVFSQILTAGGIILLYLSTYAAFGYYQLIGQKTAFVYLIILVAQAAALALVYNAPAIAIMALVGGFLTPLLLHSDRDQYRSFFVYLAILDVGALALLKRWRGLSAIAYFGTQLLFWIWYTENYQPEKRTAVIVFQTVIFLLFLLAHLGRDMVRRESSSTEDSLLLFLNPFVFFATVYSLLNPTHHNWMGLFAIGLAMLYAGAAKLLHSYSPKNCRREILLLIAVALTFLTIAIPIQLSSNWITIAWAVEGIAILWVGFEVRSARLRAQALTLFGLAFFRILIWDAPYGQRPAFIPIFNRYFISSLIVIAFFIGAIYLYQRAIKKGLIEPTVTRLVIGLAAGVAFWYLISVETHTFFVTGALAQTDPAEVAHQHWLGQMALSVVWAAYAGALAAAGFVWRAAPLRWAALVLFALTIVKAMLIDLAELQQFYRIIVFFVLGILLLLVAWAYHKAFHSRESPK